MIGIVVVSHSLPSRQAAVELADEMVHGAGPVVAVAAGAAGGFGTDATEVSAALVRAASPDGVLVLMDLGSAVLSAELCAGADGARRTRSDSAPRPSWRAWSRPWSGPRGARTWTPSPARPRRPVAEGERAGRARGIRVRPGRRPWSSYPTRPRGSRWSTRKACTRGPRPRSPQRWGPWRRTSRSRLAAGGPTPPAPWS